MSTKQTSILFFILFCFITLMFFLANELKDIAKQRNIELQNYKYYYECVSDFEIVCKKDCDFAYEMLTDHLWNCKLDHKIKKD